MKYQILCSHDKWEVEPVKFQARFREVNRYGPRRQRKIWKKREKEREREKEKRERNKGFYKRLKQRRKNLTKNINSL